MDFKENHKERTALRSLTQFLGFPKGVCMSAVEVQSTPFLIARDLGLKTFKGYVYHHVNLDVHRGRLLAVCGRNGSGKTALLLTLAGRMKHTEGTVSAAGRKLPCRECRLERQVGLGLFRGLNDLPENVSARDVVRAEFKLHGLSSAEKNVSDYLQEWDLGGVADLRIVDMTAERRARLGIALGFVGSPAAVVVDDVEDQLTARQSQGLMRLLHQRAHLRNVAVVVGVTEQALAREADACVNLTEEE